MTKIRKIIHKKINQSGSMMVEAMAMLALIALVTPTLYKKSAERTTELQDINTATHVRTLAKAVDNYVSANYQKLLEENLTAADSIHTINVDSTELASFLPYGYSFDNLKNFGTPRIALKRQGDSGSITSFIQFPKKTEIGEMRAARIASMVGSNGGYINNSGSAKGVGGVWSLDTGDINGLGFDGSKGSVVVASSEAINSATSGALENEKYLQRTKVENDAELWRNTMSTDLYMGGVAESATMNRILGVKQMIIGATTGPEGKENADLILTGGPDNSGSAWLAGNFAALNDVFKVEEQGNVSIMDFGSVLNATYTDEDNSEISFNNGAVTFVKGPEEVNTATFNTDTSITQTLSVSGNTDVAIDAESVFRAGQDGKYITAEENKLSLLSSNIVTEINGDVRQTTVATDLIAKNRTNLQGITVVGSDDNKIEPKFISEETSARLNVQGSAFVSDTLEAQKLKTENFDALELHAGGTLENTNRWLNADSTGVTIANVDDPNDKRLIINNTEPTTLLDSSSLSKVALSNTGAIFQGAEEVDIYSESENGIVSLQNGAIYLSGKLADTVSPTNKIQLNAGSTDIYSDTIKVGRRTDLNNAEYILTMDTKDDGNTTLKSSSVTVDSTHTDGLKGDLTITGNKVLAVSSDPLRRSEDGQIATDTTVQIDADGFRVSAPNISKNILNINAQDNLPKTDGNADPDDSSVYIRRGAIELERFDKTYGGANKYDANAGMGYIEASRFVSNAVENNDPDSVAEPVFALDYEPSTAYTEGEYEKYDKYMVNPAYTSVMHDIKLTTRGGARLSDILPDFINKGIYVISNTYEDNVNINNITVKNENGQLVAYHGSDKITDLANGNPLSGPNRWASAFMGVVPAPQCPPGHARVITVTPAGFQMAQAGQFERDSALNPFGGGQTTRFVMSEGNEAYLGDALNRLGENETVLYASKQTSTINSSTGSGSGSGTTGTKIYYLGYNETDITNMESKCPTGGCTDVYTPQPLYFQQSTWLRSKTIPQKLNVAGDCGVTCGAEFAGWSAVMGFVYPGNKYSNIIGALMGSTSAVDEDNYYWNVFPVQTATLEGYATVYCYFDRTNIFNSGNDARYVDQYDQLNNFRQGYLKHGNTKDNTNTSEGGIQPSANKATDNLQYLNRLDDATLKYNSPW